MPVAPQICVYHCVCCVVGRCMHMNWQLLANPINVNILQCENVKACLYGYSYLHGPYTHLLQTLQANICNTHTAERSDGLQVCLAAEKCGNLDFDVRNDMWNSSEGLYCNSSAQRSIAFWDILRKVRMLSTSIPCSMQHINDAACGMPQIELYSAFTHDVEAGQYCFALLDVCHRAPIKLSLGCNFCSWMWEMRKSCLLSFYAALLPC